MSDLFIDAANYIYGRLDVWCYTEPTDGTCDDIGGIGPMTFCYSSDQGGRTPCTGDNSSWVAHCNRTFAACNGQCTALDQQSWPSGFPGC